MALDIERIKDLIKKELEAGLTIEESVELENLLDSEDGKRFREFYKDPENLKTELASRRRAGELKEDGRRELLARLNFEQSPEEFRDRRAKVFPIRRPLFQWIAAAMVICAIGLGAYLKFFSLTPEIDKTKLAGVVPGGSKAVLTLADGSKIDLAAVKNGSIASQFGHLVDKKDSNLISYTRNLDKSLSHNPNGKPDETLYNVLTTPIGGEFTIVLPDGSKAWLNAASSIRFPIPFRKYERKVIVEGEVFFDVVKNASAPFIVSTPKMDVTVLGTQFDVRAYQEDEVTKTTLVTGSVKVEAAGGSRVLNPGERATINASTNLQVVQDKDYLDDVAWTTGHFQFHNTPIKQVMNDLARWYNVQIEYKSNLNKTFTGNPKRNSSLSVILTALKIAGGVDFEVQGNKIIVLDDSKEPMKP